MIGSDDVLACFIAGNAFTIEYPPLHSHPNPIRPVLPILTPHSDWFRLETLDDSLQPTIDMLLNLSIFMWFGAVCPWASFLHNDGIIPLYRLVFLGVLILLLRRIPIIFLLHRWIPQIQEKRQALFVGFFGPIGVSAVFYLYISLDFLRLTTGPDGHEREDAKRLEEVMLVVVWFLAISSIVRIPSLIAHFMRGPS